MKSIFLAAYTFLICCQIFSQAPNTEWAYNLGGAGEDVGHYLKKDSKGNIYNYGQFSNVANFDPNFKFKLLHNYTNSKNPNTGYLAKYSPEGKLIWAINHEEHNSSITNFFIGEKDDIYLFGSNGGTTDLDFTEDSFLIHSSSPKSFYISKYNENLKLKWVKTLDIYSYDYFNVNPDLLKVISGKKDTFYLIGTIYDSVRLDPMSTKFTNYSVGNSDLFIAKYTPDGDLLFAKELPNIVGYTGWPFQVEIDKIGDIYLSFCFQNKLDVDPGPATYYLEAPDSNLHAAICKFDGLMNLIWAKSLGGSNGYKLSFNEYYSLTSIEDIISDDSGFVYLYGIFDGRDVKLSDMPNNKTFYSNPNEWSLFLTKWNSKGELIWLHNFSKQNSYFYPYLHMDLDSFQNIYITGYYHNTFDFDFDTSNVFELKSLINNGSIFIASYDNQGKFKWVRNYSGVRNKEYMPYTFPNNILVTGKDQLYITGSVWDEASVDETSRCRAKTEFNGIAVSDIMLVKFSQCAPVFCMDIDTLFFCDKLNLQESFQVTANNVKGIQWLRSIDNGQSWSKINNGNYFSGVTTNTITFTKIDSSLNDNLFSCQLNSYCGYFDTTVSFRVMVMPFRIPEIFNRNDTLFVKNIVDIFELQWYDCDGTLTKIPGEDKSYFVPIKSGKYSLIGKSANCSANSNCIQVLVTNNESFSNNNTLKIYPNPAKDKLILEFISDSKIKIDIYNLLGIKENSRFSKIDHDHYEIEIKDVSAGNKIIKVSDESDGKILLKHIIVIQ